MVEAGGRLGLAAEALDELGVFHEAAVEHLDGHAAAQGGVLGQIDVGHAAAADPAEDPVPAVDDLAGLVVVRHSVDSCLFAPQPR